MAIPSHVMGAGNSPLATAAIVGSGSTTGAVATGTGLSDAYKLTNTNTTFTTSSASTGFTIVNAEAGMELWIRNDSGQTLTFYPPTGTTVNAGASSVTLATAKTMVIRAMSATTFATITSA